MMRWPIAAILLLLSCLSSGCLSFHSGPPPGKPKLGGYAQIGNETIHFYDSGTPGAKPKGERGTVVLVHGFGASLLEWEGLFPALQKAGYRVLAIDLLGHGWSGRPPGDYSIPAQARRVMALADLRGVDRFALVGHSWGSAVSLAATIAQPKRVSRVALYNGMFFDDQQPVAFWWSRAPGLGELIYGVFYPDRPDEKLAFAFHDPERYVTEDIIQATERLMDRPGTLAAALEGVRAMDYEGLEARYPTVQQSVLIMWGREDRVTPLSYGERLQNRLPRARLVVYPQCGHLPMIEAAGASTDELLRFLGEDPS